MVKPGLLLDENIGYVVVEFLRREGYDVTSILEEVRSVSDEEVLGRAFAEKRILITLDKDFGNLVYRRFKKHTGIIFVRLKKESPENIIKVLSRILETHSSQLEGRFITASEGAIRIKQT